MPSSRDGDDGTAGAAHERLIEAHQHLVADVARRYNGRGLDLPASIQAGHDGLRRAAERYDPARAYPFGVYATWWMRQAITRAIAVPR